MGSNWSKNGNTHIASLVKKKELSLIQLWHSFVFKSCCLWTLSLDCPGQNEWNIKMAHTRPLPILMQKSFWWWPCGFRYSLSFTPRPHLGFRALPVPLPRQLGVKLAQPVGSSWAPATTRWVAVGQTQHYLSWACAHVTLFMSSVAAVQVDKVTWRWRTRAWVWLGVFAATILVN